MSGSERPRCVAQGINVVLVVVRFDIRTELIDKYNNISRYRGNRSSSASHYEHGWRPRGVFVHQRWRCDHD